MALLAGDALQALAFRTLSDAGVAVAAMQLFADAAGSLGMAGGQGIDLDAVGRTMALPELEGMHRLKTGALIRASVLLAAHCGKAGKDEVAILAGFADTIGLLFQVTDDILDAESSTERLGKTAGKDAKNSKPTYVSLLGVDAARQRAAELRGQAHESLSHFGNRADRLRSLADYITHRQN
jgi:farnesyl diphosphate synthase